VIVCRVVSESDKIVRCVRPKKNENKMRKRESQMDEGEKNDNGKEAKREEERGK